MPGAGVGFDTGYNAMPWSPAGRGMLVVASCGVQAPTTSSQSPDARAIISALPDEWASEPAGATALSSVEVNVEVLRRYRHRAADSRQGRQHALPPLRRALLQNRATRPPTPPGDPRRLQTAGTRA